MVEPSIVLKKRLKILLKPPKRKNMNLKQKRMMGSLELSESSDKKDDR